jgi:hypothetical protein
MRTEVTDGYQSLHRQDYNALAVHKGNTQNEALNISKTPNDVTQIQPLRA